ncbi:MAG: isoaspartyl peptidase/L-asparaginase [Bdellovibrionales bacterium]|nr:isoaspartyl peptidase/L-asparaginase [Bdellovibrionales bacterium]
MDERLSEVFLQSGTLNIEELGSAPLTMIHGGAGPADPKGERILEARRALEEVLEILNSEKVAPSDFDWLRSWGRDFNCPVVTTALRAAYELEKHPNFNAGLGSVLQEDGKPRLSASFMESRHRQFTAIVNGQHYPFASLLAYALQGEKHGIRDGDGVEDLIRRWQLPRWNLVTQARSTRWVKQMLETPKKTGSHGTIGCVSVSRDGHLASVTSTGGVGYEPRGRIGDTPTIAGNFTSRRAAVSCTGRGEQIVDLGLAVRVATRVDEGQGLGEALGEVLQEGLKREMSLAAIAVASDPNGKVHWALGSTAPTFIWGRLFGGKVECF